MYLRLINVKAIERQRDSYILVINNRYEKMGESLYRINKDALEIIRNLNGTKTFDDLVDMMISCHLHGDNDDYINWFMGTQIPNITHRVKDTIMRINNSGILMRVVTMVTPQNIDQIENIAGWVKEAGIETYGISAITPMGRADLEDKNNLLLKTLEQHERVGKVIENINTRYGKGFLYKIKDGNSNAKNCGAFTSNPSITPEGEIKFCAMDNQTVIKSLGNVFKEDIGQLFSNNYQLMNMIRGIQAPDYTSKECSGCEKKYFCSYCIIRGLVAAKEKGFENCAWYSQYIPNEFRRLLI